MVAPGKVRPTSVLDRMGHLQSTWLTVLTEQSLLTRKTSSHFQLHHALVAGQILDCAKIATTAVRLMHILAAITPSHKLFPHTFLAQCTGRHLLPITCLSESPLYKKIPMGPPKTKKPL